MPYSPNRTTQHGMTLVELLIAMALALFVGAAIITVFTNNSKSFREDENMQRMQDDARNAMRELAFDISMAGHYADLIAPSSITADTTLVVGTDCGPAGVPNWIYQMQAAGVDEHLSLLAIDNADGATVNANHSCIAAAELQPGTDVVSIKRVAGGDAAVPSAGSIYLRSNGTVGLLYREPASATPPVVVPAPFKDWQYRPRIYFVRNYSNTPGDGIVRIFLLARAVQADFSYDDVKTYALSNSLPYTPADNFHRRVSSITVNIPNIRALALLGI
jgi:prepilin-type N-terminal cleavage/methylation domain-containing protein